MNSASSVRQSRRLALNGRGTMKETLRIVRTVRGYSVDFSGTSEANEMVRLFAGTIIPTPYTWRADSQTVLQEIAKRNPQYDVILDI